MIPIIGKLIPRRYLLGSGSRCWHTAVERIVPRYYRGRPALWCHGEIEDCPYRRANRKGEPVCTKNHPRRKE